MGLAIRYDLRLLIAELSLGPDVRKEARLLAGSAKKLKVPMLTPRLPQSKRPPSVEATQRARVLHDAIFR